MKFEQAVHKARKLDVKLTGSDKLHLYGLYKQATCGDNIHPKPENKNLEEYAKWNAWNGKMGLSKEEAEQEYIDHVESFLHS